MPYVGTTGCIHTTLHLYGLHQCIVSLYSYDSEKKFSIVVQTTVSLLPFVRADLYVHKGFKHKQNMLIYIDKIHINKPKCMIQRLFRFHYSSYTTHQSQSQSTPNQSNC